MHSKFLPVALAFLIWALAVGSAVAWGLQWSGRFLNTPRGTSSTVGGGVGGSESATVDSSAVARLFGAVEAPTVASVAPTTASRLSLLGVIASAATAADAALISVDGKPAKPFTIGATVIEGLVLRSVTPRKAMLGATGDAAPSITLDMPQRGEAAAPSGAASGAG